MNPTLTQTAPRQHADAAQIPADPLRAFIGTCLRGRQTPLQIIDAVKATFGIAIDDDQLIPCWLGEITLPTQTAHRQDADGIALPTQTARRQDADEIALPTQTAHRQDADEITLPTQTARRQDADEIALPTQTEHRQDKESVQFPAHEVQEPLFTRMADIETSAQTPFTITPYPSPAFDGWDADDAPATQTGHRQVSESLQIPADPADEPRVTREAQEAGAPSPGRAGKGAARHCTRLRGKRRRRAGRSCGNADRTQTGSKNQVRPDR